MATATVRLSLDTSMHGVAPRTRNRIDNALVRDRGWRNAGTGTWKKTGGARNLLQALDVLSEELRKGDAADLDHLWVYIEEEAG